MTVGWLPYGRPVSVASIDSRTLVSTRVSEGGAIITASPTGTRSGLQRCLWCGRELPSTSGVGRRRRYCAQACRQRAYENRNALERGAIPADAVVLTQQERDDLADRLYQVRCAAEDVATALAEAAGPAEMVAVGIRDAGGRPVGGADQMSVHLNSHPQLEC